MLDAITDRYAEMVLRLVRDAPIVLRPVFEQGLVKLQESRKMDMSSAEKDAVSNCRVDGLEENDSSICIVVSSASQVLKKRILDSFTASFGYMDTSFTPPSFNV